jgi:hypothetical protein
LDKNTRTNSKVSEKFGALLKQETEKRIKPKDWESILNEHLEEIKEARSYGIGFSKIADLLNEAGVKASPAHVKAFCTKTLGEAPVQRKKRRSKSKMPKQTRVAEPLARDQKQPKEVPNRSSRQASPTLKSSRPGFRSATSDEDL